MGNGKAKELAYIIHGHELRAGVNNVGGKGDAGRRGGKRRKNGTPVIT